MDPTDGMDIKPNISPPSSPIRQVSPDEIAELPPQRNGPLRFAPRTARGERQCTNCRETDTPQWRGTLCNACALWKRSRGTDRPLPLLFPVKKRSRSPTPEYEEFDDDDTEQRSPAHFMLERASPPHHKGCVGCGQMGEPLAHPVKMPFCWKCLDKRRGYAASPLPASGQSPTPTYRFYQPPRYHHHLSTAPLYPPGVYSPSSSATPTSYTIGTPRSGLAAPGALHTPVTGLRRHLPPHLANKDIENRLDTEPKGRKRAATVSGNGAADSRAHPGAIVLPPIPDQPAGNMPPPAPSLSGNRRQLSSSPIDEVPNVEIGGSSARAGRRRSTISGGSPVTELISSKEQFMHKAEWLWDVIEKSERLLERLDLEEK